MASWNKNKPEWLTEEEKKNCVATPRGWVLKRANGSEELLVAIRGLKIEDPKESGENKTEQPTKKAKNKLKEGRDESVPTLEAHEEVNQEESKDEE